MTHLELSECAGWKNFWRYFQEEHDASNSLKILTIDDFIDDELQDFDVEANFNDLMNEMNMIKQNYDQEQKKQANIDNNCGDNPNINRMKIETFRLLDVKYKIEECIIDILGLATSVENLTSCEYVFDSDENCQQCLKRLERIVRKEYYHNIKNVNCLIWCRCRLNTHDVTVFVDGILNILKKYRKILKDEFEQFNVGLRYR